MKRFIKAAWNSFNSPPSLSYITTKNIHEFDNIHSALDELQRLGVYTIVYWNCPSERHFHAGDIDYNYHPKKPDELYINDLTVTIEQNPERDGLIAYYQFRYSQYVQLPMAKKYRGPLNNDEQDTSTLELSDFHAIVLRGGRLCGYGIPYGSYSTPFAAVERFRALKKLHRL